MRHLILIGAMLLAACGDDSKSHSSGGSGSTTEAASNVQTGDTGTAAHESGGLDLSGGEGETTPLPRGDAETALPRGDGSGQGDSAFRTTFVNECVSNARSQSGMSVDFTPICTCAADRLLAQFPAEKLARMQPDLEIMRPIMVACAREHPPM